MPSVVGMNGLYSHLPATAENEYGYAEFGVTGFNGRLVMGYGMGAGFGMDQARDGIPLEFMIEAAYKLTRRIGALCSGADIDGTKSKSLLSAHTSMTQRLESMKQAGRTYAQESAEAAERFPVQESDATEFKGDMNGWMDLCIGSVSRRSAEQRLGLIVRIPEQDTGTRTSKMDHYMNIYALYSEFETPYTKYIYGRHLAPIVKDVLKDLHADDMVRGCVRGMRPNLNEKDPDFTALSKDIRKSLELLTARQAGFILFIETLLEMGCEEEGDGQWKLTVNILVATGVMTQMGAYRTHLIIDSTQQPIAYPYMIYLQLDPMFRNPCERIGNSTSCHDRTQRIIVVRMNGSLKFTLKDIDTRFLKLVDTVVVNDSLMMNSDDGMFREEVCKTIGHKVNVKRAALMGGTRSSHVDLHLYAEQSVLPRDDMPSKEIRDILPPMICRMVGLSTENEMKEKSMTA